MNLDQKTHPTYYLNEHLFTPLDCWALPDAAYAEHVESLKSSLRVCLQVWRALVPCCAMPRLGERSGERELGLLGGGCTLGKRKEELRQGG